jgi:hypothetical protein
MGFKTLKKPLPCLAQKCTCLLPIYKNSLMDKYDCELAKSIERLK